jgi:hypothetical protein
MRSFRYRNGLVASFFIVDRGLGPFMVHWHLFFPQGRLEDGGSKLLRNLIFTSCTRYEIQTSVQGNFHDVSSLHIYGILVSSRVFYVSSTTTRSRLKRNTQRSHTQNHKKQTIHTRNPRLKQPSALQQEQQPYPVTPEDGQLDRNI